MHSEPAPIPISGKWDGPTDKTSSLPLPPGFELDSMAKVGRLDTSLWKKPCVTWRKPSSWLGTMTREKHTDRKN
jgi:hypothetical protein